eukprot:1184382-Prorocentrum_minimum.AAC.2
MQPLTFSEPRTELPDPENRREQSIKRVVCVRPARARARFRAYEIPGAWHDKWLSDKRGRPDGSAADVATDVAAFGWWVGVQTEANQLIVALDAKDAPDQATRERHQLGRGVQVGWLKRFLLGESKNVRPRGAPSFPFSFPSSSFPSSSFPSSSFPSSSFPSSFRPPLFRVLAWGGWHTTTQLMTLPQNLRLASWGARSTPHPEQSKSAST